MRPSERSGHYSDVAIALHWLLALALVAAFCVGLYMTDLKLSPLRVRLFNWHKWAGISILVLSLFRLGWRLRHPPPESAASMSLLQKRLAEGLHYLLYAMFFLVPIAGWAYSSASGFPVVWFGKIPLPDFVPVDKALAHLLKELHAALSYGLAALVGLHVAAALEHQFIERDSIMLRMLPPREHRSAPQSRQ
ncbi:putative cytochrome b-561 membrane protein [Burkholderiales bacterium]|jgi:cytochrome b561|nr:putative cytochrome b-561 membrane protein [Burkholderiales bacterium]